MARSRPIVAVVGLLGALQIVLADPLDAQQPFLRADANADGNVDISDALATLGFLFLGDSELRCLDAADSNDDGEVDLADPIFSLGFLFLGGPPPEAPYPACGVDPSSDDLLGCSAYPANSCPADPSESRIVDLLEAITLRSTEPCCLAGLGVYAVRAGDCELLGGFPPSQPGCAAVDSPYAAFDWAVRPPHTLLDDSFLVEVAPILDPELDVIVLDLFVAGEAGADGEPVGPIRIATREAGPSGYAFLVDARSLPIGSYTLRASGWMLARPAVGDGVVSIDGEDLPLDPPVLDVPIVTLGLAEPFRVGPTRAATIGPRAVGDLLAAGPALDPQLEALAFDVDAAEARLRQVEATITSPEIERLRGDIRGREAERRQADAEAADAKAEAAELRSRLAALRVELAALGLINRYLDTYFGDDDLARIREQVKRREEILAGTRTDDHGELDEALARKRSRLAEVSQSAVDKKAELERLRSDHAAMGAAIRAQFTKTRRTQGDNMGTIDIQDGDVEYTITGLLVVNGGQDVIQYAPHGNAYREEKQKLDEMIESYRGLWEEIQSCDKEIENLESEGAALEDNIARLESARDEVEETDAVLDDYFRAAIDGTAPHAPHLRDLIDRLREIGRDDIAERLEDLLGTVPRTAAELEEFERKLQDLRDLKHAREGEFEEEIEDAERKAEEEDARARDAEGRASEAEDAIRELEDQLRRAEEEARREAEDAYRRAQEELEKEAQRRREQQEFDRRVRELRDRARSGDDDAMQELAELIGLTLLDEVTGELKLGTVLGGLLTAAEIPECACKILIAMKGLFGERFDAALISHANEVIRQFRECAGLPAIASVEIGSEEMARAVGRLPREQRRQVVAAIERTMRLNDC